MRLIKITIKALADRPLINLFVCLALALLVFAQGLIANAYSFSMSGEMYLYTSYTFISGSDSSDKVQVLKDNYPKSLVRAGDIYADDNNPEIVVFRYNRVLKNGELAKLRKYTAHYMPDAEFAAPEVYQDSYDVFKEIVIFALITAVILIVLIPVINYPIQVRKSEFDSYRICGAANGFILAAHFAHVACLSILAGVIGIAGLFIYSRWTHVGNLGLLAILIPLLFFATVTAETTIAGIAEAYHEK